VAKFSSTQKLKKKKKKKRAGGVAQVVDRACLASARSSSTPVLPKKKLKNYVRALCLARERFSNSFSQTLLIK
jgi:hypothetical protein